MPFNVKNQPVSVMPVSQSNPSQRYSRKVAEPQRLQSSTVSVTNQNVSRKDRKDAKRCANVMSGHCTLRQVGGLA